MYIQGHHILWPIIEKMCLLVHRPLIFHAFGTLSQTFSRIILDNMEYCKTLKVITNLKCKLGLEEYSDYKFYLMVESPCQQSGHCILDQLWLPNDPTASKSHCYQAPDPDRAMTDITGKKQTNPDHCPTCLYRRICKL